MKILSIDVGIKNLAFCLLESNANNTNDKNDTFEEYKIIKWDVINLTEYEKKLDKKIKKCIMLLSQQYMQMTTYPKLCDAFKYMFNENMNNAHNAMEDTINCYKVLRKIKIINNIKPTKIKNKDNLALELHQD